MKFNMTLTKGEIDNLQVGFGDPATNAEMVMEVAGTLATLELGGKGLLISGPCSLPVGAVIVHKVAHLYGYIAVFDPKLQGYVVAISHTPEKRVGQVI